MIITVKDIAAMLALLPADSAIHTAIAPYLAGKPMPRDAGDVVIHASQAINRFNYPCAWAAARALTWAITACSLGYTTASRDHSYTQFYAQSKIALSLAERDVFA